MSDTFPQNRPAPPGEPGTFSLAPEPPAAPRPAPQREEQQYEEVRDVVRETLETISFVVFLVLMLKAFVAEAYVIPTGSMAVTLLGDHIHVDCPRCGQKFTANASNNARNIQQVQNEGKNVLQTELCCPNCRYTITNPDHQSVNTGDKVLVLKPVYDFSRPGRHDVVVFKYPLGPQEEFTAKNYIKRLWGLPGEKLAIWGGEVYLVTPGADGREKLEIIRKAPDKMMRMRRLVNDNDRLAPKHPQEWTTSWHPMNDQLEVVKESAWEPANDGRIWSTSAKEGTAWLRYQHRFPASPGRGFGGQRPPAVGPHLITDFLAYNSNSPNGFPHDWVGDLMIEAEAEVQANTGKFLLELNEGVLNVRAVFDLQSGVCTVTVQDQGREVLRKEAPTKVNGLGKHKLRFANFDDRLTVWVDGKLVFGVDDLNYESVPLAEAGPRLSDFVPASLGVENAKVVVTHLSLWRDIYYTQKPGHADAYVSEEALTLQPGEYKRLLAGQAGPADVAAHRVLRPQWRPYYPNAVRVESVEGSHRAPAYYPEVSAAHPSDRFNADEYFMLGDNSLESQDSRDWGQVPERMLLGRAIWVYWPFNSFSSIR